MPIPKLIHVIWLQGFENLPEHLRSNVQSIIDKNPNWKVLTWSESGIKDAIAKLGSQYLDKYNSLSYLHQKVDMGRYALIFLYGGASVDTDVVALKGFDSTPGLDTSEFIVSYNSSNGFENYIKSGRAVTINNATILTSKNNPILKGLLDHILGLSCSLNESRENCIQGTTGPKEFTSYLNQYKDQITILPNVYFEPCGSDPNCEISPESLLDHRHEGSWVRDSHKQLAQIWYWIKARKVAVFTILAGIILLLIFSTKTKTA